MESDNSMEILLHAHDCPVNYRCMTNDCVECVKIHLEQSRMEE